MTEFLWRRVHLSDMRQRLTESRTLMFIRCLRRFLRIVEGVRCAVKREEAIHMVVNGECGTWGLSGSSEIHIRSAGIRSRSQLLESPKSNIRGVSRRMAPDGTS